MALSLHPWGLTMQAQALLKMCSVALLAPGVPLPLQWEQTMVFGLRSNSGKA